MRYFDLADNYGHRREHGYSAGAEFDVRVRKAVLPTWVSSRLSHADLEEIWWENANVAREFLEEDLRKRHRWIGRTMFVGRGPGWLAIEDASPGRKRNWDSIAVVVRDRLNDFVRGMSDESWWRDQLDD